MHFLLQALQGGRLGYCLHYLKIGNLIHAASFAHITPRSLLRLDATGALLSALCTTFIALRPALFGAPVYHVMVLAVFGFALFAYGAYITWQRSADAAFHLRRIAKANLLYLGLTAVVVLQFWSDLTLLARVFFIAEAVLLLLLVRYEFGVLRKRNGVAVEDVAK